MTFIFVSLLIIGFLNVRLDGRQLDVSCSWPGHCAGDSCVKDNDCDGQLTCVNNKCGSNGSSDNHTCIPFGYLPGHDAKCNPSEMSECCKKGRFYPQYKCSPASKSSTVLTLNSFTKGGSGGAAGECFGKFYPDSQPVVALSTGWYDKGSRCGKNITIHGNGRSTKAQVVDECDSIYGCDNEHDGQPPCRNNIVDASAAVWAALGVSKHDPRYGEINITWSD